MSRFHGFFNCIGEYFRISTAHGLRRCGWAVTFWAKIFWLVGFGVAMAAFVILCGFLLADFFKYPIKIATSTRSDEYVEFPAVTVCNLDASSHVLTDLIVYCSFDGSICYPQNKFKAFTSSKYGSSCFTFNSKDATKLTSYNMGRNYGLTLMLNVARGSSTPTVPNAEGFRIAVHPPGTQPYLEIEGFSLPTHFEAAVSVSYSPMERLGSPYSECIDLTLDQSGFNATSLTCAAPCIAQNQDCKCKPLCRETIVNKEYTLSRWPSPNHKVTVTNMLMSSPTWKGNLPNGGIDLTQLGTITVYFKDFTSTKTAETKAFSFPQLISELGGLSALCIGFSVLTVFEFVEFLLSLIVAPMSSSNPESDCHSLTSNSSEQYDRSASVASGISKESAGYPPNLPRMSSTPSFAIYDFSYH